MYHWVWLALAVTALWIGAQRPGLSIFEIITYPAYTAALLGYVAGKRRRWFGRNWLFWHVQGMTISYISAIIAFGFQVWPRVYEGFNNNPALFWGWMILPGILIGRWLDRRVERELGRKLVRMPSRAAVVQPQ